MMGGGETNTKELGVVLALTPIKSNKSPSTSNAPNGSSSSSSTMATPSTVVAATPSPMASSGGGVRSSTMGNSNSSGGKQQQQQGTKNGRVVMGPPLPPPPTKRSLSSTPTSLLSSFSRSSIEEGGQRGGGGSTRSTSTTGGGGDNSSIVSTTSSNARSRVGRVLKRLRKPLRSSKKRSSKASADALSSTGSFFSEDGSSVSGMESSLTLTSVPTIEDDLEFQHNNNNHSSPSNMNSKVITTTTSSQRRRSAYEQPSTLSSSSSSSGALSPAAPSIPLSYQDDLSFHNAIDRWVSTAHALTQSREVNQFVHASGNLLLSAAQTTTGVAIGVGGTVVKTASLPVTVPLYLTAAATDQIINITGFVVGGVLHHTIGIGDKNNRSEVSKEEGTEDGCQVVSRRQQHRPTQDLLDNVLNFVPFVVDTVVKKAINSVQKPALHNTHQAIGRSQPSSSTTNAASAPALASAGERSNVDGCNNDFLDRLRLDVCPMEEDEEESSGFVDDSTSTKTATSISVREAPPNVSLSDVSKYLLRVDDVNVMLPPNPASDRELRVVFVDLGAEFEDESLTTDALNQLISRGKDIASSNSAVEVRFNCQSVATKVDFSIEWKPQGQTKKELKRLSQLPESAVFESLRRQVLIWSGSFKGQSYHGCDQTIFMARGVVKGSPREFMNLMWDSSRTSEYNNYCLGRKDVRIVHDDILSGGSSGAKVIKSETSIPFTSLSVSLTALMHARAIGDDPEDGFMIFSRSLNVGRAGYHTSKKHIDDLRSNKNEILVGVNYMRPVPGHPHLTDLISVSQVNASMLPPFLAFRVGMMGVEDFFKNVR